MQLAISQLIQGAFTDKDNFSDWVAGQQAIAVETGFMFAVLHDDRATGYYRYTRDPGKETLSRGQKFVWVDHCTGLLPKVVKTFTVELASKDAALKATAIALHNSLWYEFTPLPDDCYELVVKSESAHLFSEF